MGEDCPESTRVRQRSFVGASNRSGSGPVLVLEIPESDRKKVAALRVSAQPRFAMMAKDASKKGILKLESMVNGVGAHEYTRSPLSAIIEEVEGGSEPFIRS